MDIVIIKLGALGDVLRTLPIAKALKSRNPDCKITWITKENAVELFKNNQYVDSVFSIPYNPGKKFDILYNFDIEDDATKLASDINAQNKYGFYSDGGYPAAFNLGAEYYLNTLFDDELKKSNKRTYQDMMFEAAEIQYNKEGYEICFDEEEKKYGENFVKWNNIEGKKIIGIHTGASPRWPSKVWHEANIKDFIKRARAKEFEVLVFGGPNEVESHEKLSRELAGDGIRIQRNNPRNSIREFASLVNTCNYMVCSDSLSLHIALGLKKKTAGLFFCTSPDEVEGYGLLKKIVSPRLYEFFPEKMDQYDEELVKSISADEVLDALLNVNNNK